MPPRRKFTVEQARQLLRERQLRCTPCRIAVLQQLSLATTPLSHNEISNDLVPAFDKSTVYRSLIELSNQGLVARFELGDHVWRFELRQTGEGTSDHAHFMCVECGTVRCLPGVDIHIAGTDPSDVLRHVTEVLLKGHCPRCK